MSARQINISARRRKSDTSNNSGIVNTETR